ncbi:MAG: hypothetical protein KAX44_02175 [Candidatus Brocadiae bacterium]|nr:hypothetical protein [Candidatus Brocadiia bacterium]
MVLWAGIDEAGYGPKLGPLVVADTAFVLRDRPVAGALWEVLGDAVTRHARGSDGRLVVNDSKKVFSPAAGLRRLEEGVLSFVQAGLGSTAAPDRIRRAGDLFALLEDGGSRGRTLSPWFQPTLELSLPLASNLSALRSKASVLREALRKSSTKMLSAPMAVVFPAEFNRMVALTRNKSFLLFQKCGLLLQKLWQGAGPGESYIVVDKHGGRTRYRRLLLDVFPDSRCDVLQEEPECSAYRIADPRQPGRTLFLAFKQSGEMHALPTALASMVAKYVRELYMCAFNRYWQERLDGLKPTAGYHGDAGRFLRDIAPLLRAEQVDVSDLVRRR